MIRHSGELRAKTYRCRDGDRRGRRFRSRSCARPGAKAGTPTAAAGCQRPESGDQLLAAFGAAAGENFAPVGRGHARPKPVGAGSSDFAGLVGAFHGVVTGKKAAEGKKGVRGCQAKKISTGL